MHILKKKHDWATVRGICMPMWYYRISTLILSDISLKDLHRRHICNSQLAIMKLLIMQFSPASFHSTPPPQVWIFPWAPCFQTPWICSNRGLLSCDAVNNCGTITKVTKVHAASVFSVRWQGWEKTSPWRWRQQGPPELWYPTTTLHIVTTQKISTWNITAVKASKLAPWIYEPSFE
jgi:hypothetical protein